MVMAKQILKTVWIIITLLVCCIIVVGISDTCATRRCLANELINKKLFSPPQSSECTIAVNLTTIQYETLSVDTKALRFSSRMKISMQWRDPELAWTNDTYVFEEVVLPADTIWTPDLTVDNAIETTVKPFYTDTLVRRDGTVEHVIVMYTTVVCGINLFNYPFVRDTCPIALNGWSEENCGVRFRYGCVSSVGASRGEWQTVSVVLRGEKLDRYYLSVTMSINPFNTIVTLILPSTLIMVADLVSFALPLDGGKRSSFKITLALSFTMSLLILTEHLPETGICSPLIRYHYCFCLVVLVTSLLSSMLCTRLAEHGSYFFSMLPKPLASDNTSTDDDTQKDMNLNGVCTVSADVTTKNTSVQKIVTFLENQEKDNRETKAKIKYANRFDRICFRTFLCIDIIYVFCIIAITRTEFCKINNLDFWAD